ncbi:hypothetical protein OXYTRIMIC_577 [Oxytricha trifallax]|uniref:Uncharacterized protein n=1 Tax=Oxytricha trifallax TaxID=1172189 RepID=A0A073IB06_9SPIT|nr:hypothetical protein OXYTRIMIC_577 [Oxytricha trifallax]
MQTISKAQLQNRFDTRQSCLSIRINTIESKLFRVTRRFSKAITGIYTSVDYKQLTDIVAMSDQQLGDLIKDATKTAVGIPPALTSFIRLFNIDILKNVTANEAACISIDADYHNHLNKVEIHVKCLQKHAYFLKSDLNQMMST